jgi:hypothetical protein
VLEGSDVTRRSARRIVLTQQEAVAALADMGRRRGILYALLTVLLALGYGVIAGLMLGAGSRAP